MRWHLHPRETLVCRRNGRGRTWVLTYALYKDSCMVLAKGSDAQQTGHIWLHRDTEAWFGPSHFPLQQENEDKTVLSRGARKIGKHSFNCCHHGKCENTSTIVPSLDLWVGPRWTGVKTPPEDFSSCVLYCMSFVCIHVCVLCVCVSVHVCNVCVCVYAYTLCGCTLHVHVCTHICVCARMVTTPVKSKDTCSLERKPWETWTMY